MRNDPDSLLPARLEVLKSCRQEPKSKRDGGRGHQDLVRPRPHIDRQVSRTPLFVALGN
jgi:hypothetical protein